MENKRLIILDHNPGGRLANELWNFISIYAYTLEKDIDCENYSFFNYHKYFNIKKPFGIGRLFYTSLLPLVLRKRLHRRFVRYMKQHKSNLIVDSGDSAPVYLTPSVKIDSFLHPSKKYTLGWLFRNPIGIEKYRKEIIEYFKPRKEIRITAQNIVNTLRKKYKYIIGVHWRQTDYSLVGKGELFFDKNEVNKILNEYLVSTAKDPKEIIFVICSDGRVEESDFPSLNTHTCRGNVAEDLFTLALTDRIIGSNSTYGAFAAYYGNIPIICFKREPMHWADFDQKTHFEYYNDATMVRQ